LHIVGRHLGDTEHPRDDQQPIADQDRRACRHDRGPLPVRGTPPAVVRPRIATRDARPLLEAGLRERFRTVDLVRYQRELTAADENPPIGIVLCADKNEAVVRYTLPEGNTQVFASRYTLYLPTEAELAAELQRERRQIELDRELAGEGE
jgi:hypothetical protein